MWNLIASVTIIAFLIALHTWYQASKNLGATRQVTPSIHNQRLKSEYIKSKNQLLIVAIVGFIILTTIYSFKKSDKRIANVEMIKASARSIANSQKLIPKDELYECTIDILGDAYGPVPDTKISYDLAYSIAKDASAFCFE